MNDVAHAVTNVLKRSDSLVGKKPVLVFKPGFSLSNITAPCGTATTCDYCSCGATHSRCSGGHCCY